MRQWFLGESALREFILSLSWMSDRCCCLWGTQTGRIESNSYCFTSIWCSPVTFNSWCEGVCQTVLHIACVQPCAVGLKEGKNLADFSTFQTFRSFARRHVPGLGTVNVYEYKGIISLSLPLLLNDASLEPAFTDGIERIFKGLFNAFPLVVSLVVQKLQCYPESFSALVTYHSIMIWKNSQTILRIYVPRGSPCGEENEPDHFWK